MTCLVKAQQNRQVHFGGYGEPCAAGAVALGLAWNPRVYNFRAVATVQVLREVLVALLDGSMPFGVEHPVLTWQPPVRTGWPADA
jgi:hypothetical protein